MHKTEKQKRVISNKKNKTRKSNKKKGGGKFQDLLRFINSKAAKIAAANTYRYKPLNRQLVRQLQKESGEQVVTYPLNDDQMRKHLHNDLNDKVMPVLSKTTRESDVKFSVLATGRWSDAAFILREKVFLGQKLNKVKNKLIEKIKRYNSTHITPDTETKKIYGITASILRIKPSDNKNALKKEIIELMKYVSTQENIIEEKEPLNCKYNKETDTFSYILPYKFERQHTFTWNLLNNLDISYKEIHKAYCKKWNKWTPESEPDICKTDINNYKKISGFAVNFVLRTILSFVISLGNQDEVTLPNTPKQKVTESTPYYGNVYVPILGLGINLNALLNTLYSNISGSWDTHWLNDVLAIITPIISDIFIDIGNSKDTGLDIVLLLLSKFTLISEDNLDEIIKGNSVLITFKEKLDNFLIDNHSLFIADYKKTQFIGSVTEELRTKITEFKNDFVNEIYEELKVNLMALILYGAELDGTYDEFYKNHVSEIEKSLT
jgi:hypothetical protein